MVNNVSVFGARGLNEMAIAEFWKMLKTRVGLGLLLFVGKN